LSVAQATQRIPDGHERSVSLAALQATDDPAHADEVARILSTENGKTLEDARMSVKRAIQMVEAEAGRAAVVGAVQKRTVMSPFCHTVLPFRERQFRIGRQRFKSVTISASVR